MEGLVGIIKFFMALIAMLENHNHKCLPVFGPQEILVKCQIFGQENLETTYIYMPAQSRRLTSILIY